MFAGLFVCGFVCVFSSYVCSCDWFVPMFACLNVSMRDICLFGWLIVCLLVGVFDCVFVCLCICLFVCLSVCARA